MVKAEIYYNLNKAIKISSKNTVQKIMEILEILRNLDYLEFSKLLQEKIQKDIRAGEISDKNIDFKPLFHEYVHQKLNCKEYNYRSTVVWLFTKAVYNKKSKFILTEQEEKDLVNKALDFNFNVFLHNGLYRRYIVIDKNEIFNFLQFINTYYKSDIKIFSISYYMDNSRYSISFYWESRFIECQPNDKNIIIRYIQTEDLKLETFIKKVNKLSKVKNDNKEFRKKVH